MNSQNFLQQAHLFLGLTRREFERRLTLGQIDPEVLLSQLKQNTEEIRQEALCEKRILSESLDQVDILEL